MGQPNFGGPLAPLRAATGFKFLFLKQVFSLRVGRQLALISKGISLTMYSRVLGVAEVKDRLSISRLHCFQECYDMMINVWLSMVGDGVPAKYEGLCSWIAVYVSEMISTGCIVQFLGR